MTVALNGDGGDEAFAGYRVASSRTGSRSRGRRVPGRPLRPASRARRCRAAAARAPSGARSSSRLRRFLSGRRRIARRALSRRWLGVFSGGPEARAGRGPLARVDATDASLAAMFAAVRGLDAVDAFLRGRHRLVSADRPARQNGHRDDGQFAGGAVAVSRSPSGRVRRASAEPFQTAAAGPRSTSSSGRSPISCRPKTCRRAKRGFAVPIGRWFRGRAAGVCWPTTCWGAARSERGLFEPRGRRAPLRRTSVRPGRSRASSLGAADARALVSEFIDARSRCDRVARA